MSTPVAKHPLQSLLEGVACESLRSYRYNMHERECLAVVGSLVEIVAAIVEGCLNSPGLAMHERRAIERVMHDMHHNTLGKDDIVYWPSVPHYHPS
jgi:hypothetical protein